jgi:hypothetical protein
MAALLGNEQIDGWGGAFTYVRVYLWIWRHTSKPVYKLAA